MVNLEELRDVWRERVAAYRASGMQQKDWCAENGLKQSTLKNWVTRINKEQENEDGPKWLELEVGEKGVAQITPSLLPGGIIIRAGKLSIEINSATDEEALNKMMKVLLNICL